VDEQTRGRIRDDLRGIIKEGDLLFDELSRALYSTDASIFQVMPAGVVVPRNEGELQALVRYAFENQVPLIPRGAGTGLAGESLGTGLIVDVSRHFRDIVEVGADFVRVQPGVTCKELNARLASDGRRFAPDPASGHVCTVGGMVANNASGARALKYGYTRDYVRSLRAVFDNGETTTVGRESLRFTPSHLPLAPGERGVRGEGAGHAQDIVGALAVLLEEHHELIQSNRPKTKFNRCGYLLHDVLDADSLHLARLLVGSEGTLAMFTEATLETIPLPQGRALLLLGFGSLDAALRAVPHILPTGPAACELIDRRMLSLARGSDAAAVAALVPAAIEAVILVDYESDTPHEARQAVEKLSERLVHIERLAHHVVPAFVPADLERVWTLREIALPSLFGLKGGAQPVPFIEDVGVPPEVLAEFLHRVQEIMQEHETTASFMVHAGAGQVHTRPFLNLQKPEDKARLGVLAEKVHALALELGGTVSTQHGTGLARTPWVARQYGPLYSVFRQIKSIFDPKNIFNPGKIVDPEPEQVAWPLRRSLLALPMQEQADEAASGAAAPAWQLRWDGSDLHKEIHQCNGCGHCRIGATVNGKESRMCPIFHATHTEAAAPRAKANLLRHALNSAGNGATLASDEVRNVADLCVNCKMCAHECPARVNIPKLMLEAKAANVAEHGIRRSDWLFARIQGVQRVGSAFALLANQLMRSRWARWAFQKVFDLAPKRRLPRFAYRNFFRIARRRGWTRKPENDRPRLAYFVDSYAAYNEPQIAVATVRVLQHQGFSVYVPPEQKPSGAANLTYGDVESSREIAGRNIHIMSDLVRQGYRVVCTEPTAAVMFQQDYLDLSDDPDAQLVAQNTVELSTLLREVHGQGNLRSDFTQLPYSIGHHVPCHIKALGKPAAGPSLLNLIPDLRVHTIDVSCSGMAGTFGLKASNYETSLAAGRPMLQELARPGILFGSTECSACRLQMEDAGGKRTLHPVEYLALAYGLMPEIARRFEEPMRDLVLR